MINEVNTMEIEEIAKKEIDYLISVKTHILTLFLAVSGSSIALLLNLNSLIKCLLFVLGLWFSLMLFNSYSAKTVEIKRLFKQLKENNNAYS